MLPHTTHRHAHPATSTPRARGFSLLEMMLVVLIMGVLMSVVVVAFGGQSEKAKRLATIAKMKQVKTALQGYSTTYGTYPPTEAGLAPLAVGLTKELERIPKDDWSSNFYYMFPGSSGNLERPFDLKSLGPDKQLNTNDDIDIWTVDEGR
jgi:general secretion pathway protein G